MQTIYRIRQNGREIMRGRRSWIVKKLSTKALRDRLSKLQIDVCKYEPKFYDCPKWTNQGSAATWLTQGQ